jgi:hypothetical protein
MLRIYHRLIITNNATHLITIDRNITSAYYKYMLDLYWLNLYAGVYRGYMD